MSELQFPLPAVGGRWEGGAGRVFQGREAPLKAGK